jgi:hypothetical protein
MAGYSGELNHKLFIKEVKNSALQAMILKRCKQLMLKKTKKILRTMFVKKMKKDAARAFMKGAYRRRDTQALRPWKEVVHWCYIVKAHERQLAEIEKASELLHPCNPFWATLAMCKLMRDS